MSLGAILLYSKGRAQRFLQVKGIENWREQWARVPLSKMEVSEPIRIKYETDELKVQDISTGTTEKIKIKDDMIIDKKFDSDDDIGNVLLTDATDSIPNGHPRRSHDGGYGSLVV